MAETFADCIAAARDALMAAKKLLQQEISNYPTPISGCDAQFNHLLAERARVLDALAGLNETVFIPTPRAPGPSPALESR